jgi:YesN/AraC family two-component response regulator
MPEMDGNELTKYIRNHMGAKSNVPIIALTAHATLEEEKRCMENGMNDYLSKPFHFNVLLEKLYNNLMNTNTTVSSDSAIQTINAEKLIDFKYLNEFADGDADFVKKMLFLFIQNSPIALQIILESNEADDINILKSEVHKFKSSISLLGIVSASKSIGIIEEEINMNPFGQKRKEEVIHLNEICQSVFTELESLLLGSSIT